MRPSMSPSTHRWPSVATSCLRTMNSSTRSESTTSTQPFGRPTVTRSVAFSRVFETPSSGGASKSSSRDRGCAGGRGCCHGGAFAGCTCTCRSMFTRGQGLAGIGPVFSAVDALGHSPLRSSGGLKIILARIGGCRRTGMLRRQGAFARSTCTCRSMFTSARHSPARHSSIDPNRPMPSRRGCSARAAAVVSSTSDAAISSSAASPDRGFRRPDDPACAR